jgi:hypothetical protein
MLTTDKEIIVNHLERYYKPSIKPNRDDVFDSLMGCSFILSGKHMSEMAVIEEIESIFGTYVTDENMTPREIVSDWLREKSNSRFEDILDALNDVKVVFGSRSWEVKKDGKPFDLELFIEELKGKYNKPTVVAVYEKWKHTEIIRISDEILNS